MGRRCYVYPPPGGGTTANIPLGTMTLTPQAPTLSISGGTGPATLYHGQTFTLSGSGFGTKTGSWTANITGSETVGTLSSQWNGGHAPQSSNPTYTNSNPVNRATTFNPSGAAPGVPNPFVQGITAGAHYSDSAPAIGNAIVKFVAVPAQPYVVYASCYVRNDANWSFTTGEGTNDHNVKGPWSWAPVSGGIPGDTLYGGIPLGITDTSTPIGNTTWNDNVGNVCENPDRNGNGRFWPGFPQYWTQWIKLELEICVDKTTGPTGKGYIKTTVNGVPGINYAGATDGSTSGWTSAVDRFLSLAPSLFVRDYGPGSTSNTGAANNWWYVADVRAGISGTGITGALAKVIIGDQPTLAASTQRSVAIDSSWGNAAIPATFWQDQFTVGQTVYAHVVTQAGAVLNNQAPGPFIIAAVPTFDFFISTTGSDSNSGTLASPWAITAINTKQATYAGKRVGIVAGTYDVSGLMGTFQSPALQIQGGPDSSHVTYIGACDVSGNYSQRVVTLNAKGTNGLYGGGNSNLSTIMGVAVRQSGGGPTPTQFSNWTIDGISFQGFSIWAVQFGTYDATGGVVSNATIQNCEFANSNASSLGSGRHTGPVEIYKYSNVTVSNCYFHDNLAGPDADHYASITAWGGNSSCSGLTITKCTFVNTPGVYGIYDFGTIIGTTISQCYFDMASFTSITMPAIQGFGNTAGTGGAASTFNNNIIRGGKGIDTAAQSTAEAWATVAKYYNNTIDLAGKTADAVFRFIEASGKSSQFSCYNNLYYDNGSASASSYGYNASNVDAFAVCDYNIYGTINNAFSTYPAGAFIGNTNRNFSTWKANINGGAEAHSITNATNPFTNTGARALAYKVTAGVGFGTGKIGGVIGGAACNIGAWDGAVTQIGSTLNGTVD